MKVGDLVLCNYYADIRDIGRNRKTHFGVVVRLDSNVFALTRFHDVLIPGGKIKLFAETFLEEV